MTASERQHVGRAMRTMHAVLTSVHGNENQQALTSHDLAYAFSLHRTGTEHNKKPRPPRPLRDPRPMSIPPGCFVSYSKYANDRWSRSAEFEAVRGFASIERGFIY